ncbi:hypothetical protein [Tahibacter harae]|uniref:Uncharacterized protein n=1 Tax=Tahibacter harae TaxID=2963937 RepID=A0ABT1QX74_9GAMM|nr:hypothetical protein [Tahibacter harae]MCQ4166877.1 hypothetical protein [Tahibacter harae]
MSFTRLLLHAAALVLPALVIGIAVGVAGGNAAEIPPLAGFAMLAAQLAALAGWPLLDSAARRPGLVRPVLAGLFMAVLTHVLFGVLLSLGLSLKHAVLSDLGELLRSMVFFVFLSLMLAGWATAPALMGLAAGLCRLRRGELAAPAGN